MIEPEPAVAPTRRGPPVTWLLRYYPFTVLLAAPYAIVVIPLAVVHGNPALPFILWLVFLAAIGVVGVESLHHVVSTSVSRRRLVAPTSGPTGGTVFGVARVVAVASVLADVGAAYLGRGSIVHQLAGDMVASPAANVLAALAGWKYLAAALLLYAVIAGHVGPAAFYRWGALLVLAQAVLVALTAIAAPLIGYVSFLAAAGAIMGVVRARYVVVAVAVMLAAWPMVFSARNDLRLSLGVPVAIEMEAADRLRFDSQVGLLRGLDVPVNVGQPESGDMVRYALVPRALDPDRPQISTGVKINQYLGGPANSAYSFLAIGNVYFLSGPTAVVLFYLSWTVVAVLLRTGRPGPVRVHLLCVIIAGPLAWTGMYPDAMIGSVQYLISALPVFVLLRAIGGRPKGGSSRPAPMRTPVAGGSPPTSGPPDPPSDAGSQSSSVDRSRTAARTGPGPRRPPPAWL
jgi:hypothetical protein